MEFIILIAVIVGVFFCIRWAIGFVRTITYETGHSFFGYSFWIIVLSMISGVYVAFNVTPEYWTAVTVFGLIGVAGFLNIRALGGGRGLTFTLLQCAAIYAAIIVWILYAVFKNAKELGPKI